MNEVDRRRRDSTVQAAVRTLERSPYSWNEAYGFLPPYRKSDTPLLRQPQGLTHWPVRGQLKWNRLFAMVKKHLLSGNRIQMHHALLF